MRFETNREGLHMKTFVTIVTALVMGSVGAPIYAQSLLPGIQTPDKAVPAVNQMMDGVWLLEVQRGGQGPVVSLLMTYHADGTVTGTAADASQTAHQGMWIRVGDRKFLQTMFLFTFSENRVLTGVTKLRVNIQLSQDGKTFRATQEVIVLTPAGQVVATVPGGTATGTRLSLEIPADFYDFQKLP